MPFKLTSKYLLFYGRKRLLIFLYLKQLFNIASILITNSYIHFGKIYLYIMGILK